MITSSSIKATDREGPLGKRQEVLELGRIGFTIEEARRDAEMFVRMMSH